MRHAQPCKISHFYKVCLCTACLLQLAEIQDICCEFLKRQLDPSNCLGIRAFADTHSCRDLLRIADKFTQHNFQEVFEFLKFFYFLFNLLAGISQIFVFITNIVNLKKVFVESNSCNTGGY